MIDAFVRAVIIKDKKIFLLNEEKKGRQRWVFPGGKVEANETITQALERELYEELGVYCLEYKKLFSQAFSFDEKMWYGYFFLCTVDSFNFVFEPCVKKSSFLMYDEILKLNSDIPKEDFVEIAAQVKNSLDSAGVITL